MSGSNKIKFQSGQLEFKLEKNIGIEKHAGKVRKYRHSSIYAVNVGTQEKNRGSKNLVNRG